MNEDNIERTYGHFRKMNDDRTNRREARRSNTAVYHGLEFEL